MFNLGLKFNLADGKKINSEDLVFWGVITITSLAMLFFLIEGFVLYQKFLGSREKAFPSALVQSLTSIELDETLKIIDKREKMFNEILQSR